VQEAKINHDNSYENMIYPTESQENNEIKITEQQCDHEALPTHQRIS
jgi:hypothetical protein